MGTAASGEPSSRPKENTLATLVSNIPIHEVAPDTWELPAHDAKEIGNHSSQLLFESLGSATPSVTMRYGIALTVDTSLGNGTLDRRGFLVNHLTLASRLGLDMGDRILFVNDEPVNSLGGLYRIHKKLKSDSQVSEVKLVVNRSNQLRTLTYRLR
jgi:S1-C subfamily serine protease